MKRLLSLLLVFAMVASYLPVTAGAEETVPAETTAEIIETVPETVPVETEAVETIPETTEEVIPETSEETVPETTAPQWELPVIPDMAMELPGATTNGYSFTTFARNATGNPGLHTGNHEKWIDRVDLEAYAISLYDWLAENSDNDGNTDALIDVTQGEEYLYTDSETGATLAEGYVHSLTMIGGDIRLELPYDVKEEELFDALYEAIYAIMEENFLRVTSGVCAVFDAFDRDHPEVFWLDGRFIRTAFYLTEYDYNGSVWIFDYEQDFLLDLSVQDYDYGKTLDVRAADYQTPAAIRAGITRRDNAVAAILAEIPANTNAAGKAAFFNDWLTRHNGYNTSADLYAIGYDCRECLSALTGSVGANGPVCEGYARAFKVLCDAANISCVLVNGDADNGSGTEPHMWNYVNILGAWYGVDVTWNDPGSGSSAVSGHECEDYLLVGSNTVVGGMTFSQSHSVSNVVTDGGVAFTNGPKLSETDYCVHSFDEPVFRYENGRFYADFTCFMCELTETVPGVITGEHRTDATATKDGSVVYTVAFTGPDGMEYTHTHTVVIPATGSQDGLLDNGTLGDNLTWTLDKNGKLTISGSGFMQECQLESQVPWAAYRDQIVTAVIEEGITSVGTNAFYGCWKLEEVSLPSSLESVYPYAFYGCKNLKSVTLSDNVVMVGNYAFYLCEGMETLELGESVGLLGECAFDMCRSLTDITIPASVSTISAYAFRSCEGLETVTFEGRWPVIVSNAFEGDTFDAYYPADEDTWAADKLLNYGGRITWHAVTGSGEVIPQNLSGKCGENLTWTLDMESGVMTISGTGFMDNKDSSIYKPWYEYQEQITKVVIEEGVTSIGKNMFALMPSLTEVRLPKTLRIIQAAAFEMSKKLKAIDLTYVERVESAAFHDCIGLTEVTIPDGIALEGSDNRGVFTGCTGIKKVTVGNFDGGYYLFSGCTALTDVTLKEGLEALGGHMFDGCTALKTVNIPAGVDIGGGAFANCTALTSVTCTREIGTVGEKAFAGCTGLTSFTFPQTEALGSSIFFLCDNLSSIYFKGSAPTFDKHTLNNIKVTIYYPSGDSSWDDKINGHFGANIDLWKSYDVSHTFEATVTAPTCVSDGYTTYLCSDCGYGYQGNPVAATGVHTYLNNQDTSCEICGFIRDVAENVKTFSVSGDLSMSAPSQENIAAKSAAVTTPTTIFARQPSVTAPYAIGKLSEGMLSSGLAMLNYFRYTAKLPQVQMADALNDKAQHGAVLLAAIDKLTHYPSKPADMDDAFYEIGAASTSSSNISWNMGYSAAASILIGLEGCLHDSDSYNIQMLGHRRWLLNPTLLNVGFGYAQSTNGGNYSTTQVFDRSGKAVDYDFVSFPASGNFPTNLFDKTSPWSVTLNPQRFETPNRDQLTIKITRQSDGLVWTLNSSNAQPTADGHAYLGVNKQGYGVSNCIIFSPGANNLGSCTGTFTVEITGLKTWDGKDARLLYEVNFFDTEDVNAPHICEYTKTVTAPTCTEKGYTTYTCSCGDSYVDDYTDALGHTEVVDAKVEPTCTEPGKTEGKHCSNCNTVLVKQDTIPAKGHTEVVDPKVDPTCTGPGKTEGKHCSVCSQVLVSQEEIPAIAHKWDNGKVTTEPTATEDGVKTYTCANCGETKTEAVPATGEEILWGDANGDGFIDGRDSLLIARYAVGMSVKQPPDFITSNVNGDAYLDGRDALLIARYAVGAITKFPVQNK